MGKDSQRVDFNVVDFEQLVKDKGYSVLHHKGQICPCANELGETQLMCPHCGNTGRYYIGEPARIKAIMTGMSKDYLFDLEGVTATGLVYITTNAKHRLGFADKITLLDGKIVYSEIILDLHTIPKFRYPLLDVESVVSFNKVYVEDTDYSFIDGVFTWLKPVREPFSIRYITYPVFIILNFPNVIRGTQAKVKQTTIKHVELPVKALAKLEFKVKNSEMV